MVADGGLDLEHFEPRSFEELQSILMQARIYLNFLTLPLAVLPIIFLNLSSFSLAGDDDPGCSRGSL